MPKSVEISTLLDESVLSSPPELLVRIIRSLNSNLTSHQIGEIIGQDQGVSAQVLRLANSSFFGFKGQVGTLDKAINILGTKMVRNIVMSSSLISHTQQLNLWNLNLSIFWLHTFLVAEFSRQLALTAKINPDETYVAGLLHDIGKLILYSRKKDKTSLFSNVHTTQDVLTYEETVCGFSSIELSTKLLAKWHIPKHIIHAISDHDNVESTDVLANVIFLANQFATVITDRFCKTSFSQEDLMCMLKNIGLHEDSFRKYAAKLPAIAKNGEQILETLSKNKGESRRSRRIRKVTLVSPQECTLSQSLLELIGYQVDSLHPNRVKEYQDYEMHLIEKEEREVLPDPDEKEKNATNNVHPLRKLTDTVTLLRSLVTGKGKNENERGDEDLADEKEIEPIRWQFLVVFDGSPIIDLPQGRIAYSVNPAIPGENEKTLPYFFTAADFDDKR